MDAKKITPALLNTFDEKVAWWLSYLYEHGGKEYKEQKFNSDRAYSIPEVKHPDEFKQMMTALKVKGWATWEISPVFGREFYYIKVLLTEQGIREVEKGMPQIPLIGLVSQEITTGDSAIDAKINQARSLFFSDYPSMDSMRSACEALCFVLEPLRYNGLKSVIADADVELFFQMVNKFDIRHNNHHTKTLKHPEQLEWVFYSLLNTINTYTKLKKRLQP